MKSLSKSRVNKLGERLRAGTPSEEGLRELQNVRAAYDEPLAAVERRLRGELGLLVTSRIKTVNTIIEKLKRDRTRLSTMQDIAGARVVRDMNLIEQDRLVESVCSAFPDARVDDKREHPSHGYRAVHVIVRAHELPVEIQIRTRLQDMWAQTMEKLADSWGREIRYGGPPRNPDLRVGNVTASQLVERLLNASTTIRLIEGTRADLILDAPGLRRPLSKQGGNRPTYGRERDDVDTETLRRVLDGWEARLRRELESFRSLKPE